MPPTPAFPAGAAERGRAQVPDDAFDEASSALPGLRLGYAGAPRGGDGALAALQGAGCDAVRTETCSEGAVLASLLAFLTPGDLLVLPNVRHLPCRFGGLERLLRELDARGAAAVLLDEALSTSGESGLQLRRAVAAAAEFIPAAPRPRPTAALRTQARTLAAHGARPGDIARDLQVSRMTVWRWLKTEAG